MSIGGICLAYAGFALFLSSDDNLGTWGMIVPYLIIYGIGRGTWENTNKAVVADLYTETPDLSTSAFASIAFFNGLAGMSISMNMGTHTIFLCSLFWSLINYFTFAVTFFKLIATRILSQPFHSFSHFLYTAQ